MSQDGKGGHRKGLFGCLGVRQYHADSGASAATTQGAVDIAAPGRAVVKIIVKYGLDICGAAGIFRF